MIKVEELNKIIRITYDDGTTDRIAKNDFSYQITTDGTQVILKEVSTQRIVTLLKSLTIIGDIDISGLSILQTDELLSKFPAASVSNTSNGPNIYSPNVSIDSISTEVFAINTSSTISISGIFLDFVNSVNVSASVNNAGILYEIESKNFNELVLSITTSTVPQILTFTLNYAEDLSVEFSIEVIDSVSYIPTTNTTGIHQWIIPDNQSNDVILTDGGFESPDINGNGWNDHAICGPFNSPTETKLTFTIDRVDNNRTAYANISLSTTNTNSPSENPAVYIVGHDIEAYDHLGNYINSTTCDIGDSIGISIKPNEIRFYKNEIIFASKQIPQQLADVYLNITAYQAIKLSQILIKTYY